MARWLLLGLLPVAALGADFTSVDAQLRGDQQVRVIPTQGTLATLELFPNVLAAAHLSDLTLSLGYAPQLLFGLAGRQPPEQVMHLGRAQAELRCSPDRRLLFSEQGRYGQQDTLSLVAPQPGATGSPAPPQTVPSAPSVELAESDSEVLLDWGLAPGLKGTLDALYVTGGGVGGGRALVPGQRRLQLSAGLSDQVSRVDSLTTTVLGSHGLFSTGTQASVGEALELWSTRPARGLALQLGLGVAATRGSRPHGGLLPWEVLPGAQAGSRATLFLGHSHLDLDVLAELGPYVDWILGTAYPRGDGTLSLHWTDAVGRVELLARGQGALSAGSAAGQKLASAEGSVTWHVSRPVALQLGSRLMWQQLSLQSRAPYREWLSYLSVILTGREVL